MITADNPWGAAEFLRQHNTSTEHPDTVQAFCLYSRVGELVGAISFHHANSRSVMGDIALKEGHNPRRLIHIALWYAFAQLKVKRLTMFVAAHNLKSIAFVERLGAYRGATLIDGCSDGEVYIYYLLPDQCPLWSRLNGKTVKYTGSAGPEGNGPTSRD